VIEKGKKKEKEKGTERTTQVEERREENEKRKEKEKATAWAHIFWILPVIFIIMCTIKYRAVMPLPSRIRSLFEPAERYVTRSQSWPQMNDRDENRTNSEPAFTTVVF
jgi:hypothetical protein